MLLDMFADVFTRETLERLMIFFGILYLTAFVAAIVFLGVAIVRKITKKSSAKWWKLCGFSILLVCVFGGVSFSVSRVAMADGFYMLDESISVESNIESVLRSIGVEKINSVEVDETQVFYEVYVETDKCMLWVELLDTYSSNGAKYKVFEVCKDDLSGNCYYVLDGVDYKGRQMFDIYEFGTDKLIKEADPATKEEGYIDELEELLNN